LKQSKAIEASFAAGHTKSPAVELEAYLDALASSAPTPGGGSAATLVIAFGAALVAMVARITRANSKYAAKASLADELSTEADILRSRALTAREQDETAYRAVVAALALPRASNAEQALRTSELQRSLAAAAEAPLQAAELAAGVAALAARALELENAQLASDLGCAADFAAAGLSACAFNVRVNHRYMKDRAAIEHDEALLTHLERESAPLIASVRAETARALARA